MAEKKGNAPVSKTTETKKIKKAPAKTEKTVLEVAEPTPTEKKKILPFSLPKRKEKQPQVKDVKRFRADADIGLSTAQVEERVAQGLVNKTTKKYSKTYRSIFLGNICTFFNLL